MKRANIEPAIKTITVITLLFVFFLPIASTQTDGESEQSATAMAIKRLMEKQLVGTGIYGQRFRYIVEKDSLSMQYAFRCDAKASLPTTTLTRLVEEMNTLLSEKEAAVEIVGEILFDDYTDSVVVDVRYGKSAYLIFQVAKWIPVPPEGYSSFSKRLHDHLKNEIKNGRVSIETLADISQLEFLVLQFGYRLKAKNDDPLAGLFDAFLEEESKSRNWTKSIWSGLIPDVKIDLIVFAQYLNGTSGWPDSADWATTHEIVRLQGGVQLDETERFYFTPMYNTRLANYTTVSMVYDPMLRTYRLPFVHSGSPEKAADFIKALGNHQSNVRAADYPMTRVYFYCD